MMPAQQFAKGEAVLVSVRGGAGGHEVEQPGIVTEMAGKGAFVKLERGGNSNFFYLGKIRRNIKPIQTNSNAPFKLADVAKINPPRNFDKKPETPVKLGLPPPSTIGQLIYQIRQERGVMQEAFARAIGVSAVTLSAYEHGRQRPKDDELLLLAEVFDYDLTPLVEANEKFVRSDVPETKPDLVVVAPEIVPPKHRGVDPASRHPVADTFEHFYEMLTDVAPIPLDKSLRRDWLRLAKELFTLGWADDNIQRQRSKQ